VTEPVTRALILRLAAEEFGRNGFRGARLDDVAARLGVTRQALYYYYPTKHAILTDLYERFFELLENALDAAEAAHSGHGRFDAMLEAHVRTVAEVPELSAIFSQERASLPDDAAAAVRRRRNRYQKRLVAAYRAGVEGGELRGDCPPDVAVSLAVGAANWVFQWYRASDDLPPAVLARTAVEVLGSGYRTGTTRRRAATR
jgi:AcrR family transcriptional regulator